MYVCMYVYLLLSCDSLCWLVNRGIRTEAVHTLYIQYRTAEFNITTWTTFLIDITTWPLIWPLEVTNLSGLSFCFSLYQVATFSVCDIFLDNNLPCKVAVTSPRPFDVNKLILKKRVVTLQAFVFLINKMENISVK